MRGNLPARRDRGRVAARRRKTERPASADLDSSDAPPGPPHRSPGRRRGRRCAGLGGSRDRAARDPPDRRRGRVPRRARAVTERHGARARASALLLRAEPPSPVAGIAVALLAVATITALIFPLRTVTPAVSTGVLYLLAVLLVSTVWGLWLGPFTSVASTLAFNFFHIPPTGRFTVIDGGNWVALGVFFVAALVAGSVAEPAPSRAAGAELPRREADRAAALARLLLGPAGVEPALAPAGERLAAAFDLP